MEDERRVEKRKLTENIPAELKAQKSWVGYITRPNGDRIDKIPMNVLTGRPAKSNDPATWTDFDNAIGLAIERNYAGIGFMFQPPYVGVDFDHCIKESVIAPHALEILALLNTYSESSPSGTGIHAICKGNRAGWLENICLKKINYKIIFIAKALITFSYEELKAIYKVQEFA